MPGADAKTMTGPVKAAQGPLTKAVRQSSRLYSAGSGFHTPKFQTVAPLSGATQQGMSGMMNYAAGGNPLAGMSQDAVKSILGGNIAGMYGDLYNNSGNQAFGSALDAQAGHLTDDINREFSGLGRTGSAAQSGTIAQQVGEARNTAMANNWNQNVANQRGILDDQVNSQMGAIQAAPGAWQQGLLPSMVQGQVGAAQDAHAQAMRDARTAKFNANDMAQWNRLNAFRTSLGGPAAALGSQTTSTAATNPLGGLAGGALTGALAGNQIGGASGAGWGGLIGAGLGFGANLLGL